MIRSHLRALRGRRPLIRLLALAAALLGGSAVAAEQGLLWRVEGAAGKPSYLFGTVHSDDPRVTRLQPPVARALDGADSFVMEVVLDPMALVQLTASSMLPPQQSLGKLVGEATYRRVVDAMAGYGYPEPAVSRLKPWVVLSTLSIPRPRSGEILDLVLYKRALGQGKSTHGLETVAEQVAVMDEMPIADQIVALNDTLDHLDELDRYFGDLFAAYLSRDLTRLVKLSDQYLYLGDAQVGARFMARLVDERNRRMAQRVLPYLNDGGAFVAVGALHLPGPQGLIALLRQAGWRVTAVY